MDLRNRLLYRLFRGLSWLAIGLPDPLALAIGWGFAEFLWVVYRLTPHRDFVARNILAAYGPSLDERQANRLARASIHQLVSSIVEVLQLPSLTPERLAGRVRIEGEEHLTTALAAGKGVVVVTAHFGNWEILGAVLATRAAMSVLVQPPSQAAFDRLFQEFRTRVGVVGYPNRGPASLRPVLRHLRAGGILGLLCDQHGETQDGLATFFGHPVSVPPGPFFFASKTGAAILPMRLVRERRHRHVLHVDPPILPTENSHQDAQQLCDRYEAWIRTNPDHWLWVHNRWEREAELPSLASKDIAPSGV